MKRFLWILLTYALSCLSFAAAPPGQGSYAVAVTEATWSLPDWKQVVEALRTKHDADLILCENSLLDAQGLLSTRAPDYVCFVGRPEELGRDTVVGLHRLLRTLDSDPYTDALWGMLTGYEAADALRIAQHTEPLTVNSAASSMGPELFKNLEAGFASSESNAGVFWQKKSGGEVVEREVTPDPTAALAEAFQNSGPDAFLTSGHATEQDWQIGYNVRAGQFRCSKGGLFALGADQSVHPFRSPNPKVYLPVGNCLIGHIPKADCMATAWIHSGGVMQMFGYTAVTFHGYMGWGTGSLFHGQPGRYTLAEAFYFNNQALVHELQTQFPEQAGFNLDNFDQPAIQQQVRTFRIRDKKLLGHLWDRDTVAFYGDPAWVARWRKSDLGWEHQWSQNGEANTCTLTVLKDGTWENRPAMVFLPERVQNIRDVVCSAPVEPVVTDNFLLVPLSGRERKTGDTVTVTFQAETMLRHTSSAQSVPARTGSKPGPGAEQQAMDFLVEHMPARDRKNLSEAFLKENVELALRARKETPWGPELEENLFLDYVLPYACLDERRDPWRADFFERCLPLIKGCKTTGEAAVKLNTELFPLVGVQYHATKRPKADQSPYESIEAGYASCTGLSILLVDACRAVGIPARVVGVPLWADGKGNHTWVEVWDQGWHMLGAAESKSLGKVWFRKQAAAAVAKAGQNLPQHRIYAAVYRRTPLPFPLVWNPQYDEVNAIDVSERYRDPHPQGGTTP